MDCPKSKSTSSRRTSSINQPGHLVTAGHPMLLLTPVPSHVKLRPISAQSPKGGLAPPRRSTGSKGPCFTGAALFLPLAPLAGLSWTLCRAGRGRRGMEGVPIFNQLREMWRRKLKLCAVLSVLMATLWLWQGYQGWTNLSSFNATQPWYRRLPGSTAIESWLLGTHPVVMAHGHGLAVTKSTLQRDFAMDTLLVDEGQLHRLLTACFLHNSIFHILFNLGYLYTLAPLEVGCRGAFLSTFLISGIVGNLAFLHFGEARYALGASGGLCALAKQPGMGKMGRCCRGLPAVYPGTWDVDVGDVGDVGDVEDVEDVEDVGGLPAVYPGTWDVDVGDVGDVGDVEDVEDVEDVGDVGDVGDVDVGDVGDVGDVEDVGAWT
eukprot:s427_g19.t1